MSSRFAAAARSPRCGQVAVAAGLGVYVGPVHLDLSYGTLTLAAGDGTIASLSISVWPGVSSRQP